MRRGENHADVLMRRFAHQFSAHIAQSANPDFSFALKQHADHVDGDVVVQQFETSPLRQCAANSEFADPGRSVQKNDVHGCTMKTRHAAEWLQSWASSAES